MMTCIGDKEVWFEDVVLHYRVVSYSFASECIILLKTINISYSSAWNKPYVHKVLWSQNVPYVY